MGKNKIPKPKKIKKAPKIPKVNKEQESNIKVNFIFKYNNWLKSSSNKEISNYLKNSEEYSKNITKIFYEIIPIIQEEGFNYAHSHRVESKDIKKLKDIIADLHGDKIKIDTNSFWQIGIKGSIRIIGMKIGDINFYPLYIDHHHELYQSTKHNMLDTKKNRFCPVVEYIQNNP